MKLCPACRKVDLTPLRRGGFFCEECGQRFDAGLKSIDRARATVILPAAAWDDPSLPFAIASPLSRAHDARLPLAARFSEAASAAYETVRMVGLLLLSDYLASTAKSRRVGAAVRALRAPDWWAWTVLNNQLCRFWSGELDVPPDRETAFPKVTAGWRSVNRRSAAKKESRWGTLLEGLPGRSGTVAQSANDALWRARDDADRVRRGEGDPPTEDELKRLLGVIDASTSRLFPRGSVEIVRRLATPTDKAHLVRMHGAHPNSSFPIEIKEREWGVPFGVSPVIAVTRDATVPLYPLFFRFDGATRHATLPTSGLLEPLVRDGDLARLAPRSSGLDVVASSTLAALRRRDAEMLASSHEIVPSTLAQFAAGMVDVAAGDLSMRARDTCHVARVGVDDVAEEALRTAGRALLIVGAAGVGKTTLAARLALSLARLSTPREPDAGSERSPLAETGGDLVVFLSGRNAYAGPDGEPVALSLKRTILRRLGVREDAFASLHHFFSAIEEHGAAAEGRRLVLVLDGVDEADDFDGLVAAIDELLPALPHHPALRLCVTMRTSSFRSLGRGRGPRGLENVAQLLSFQSGQGDDLVPYLEMRPFDAQELARAYAAARELVTPLPPLDDLAVEQRSLLTLPLHLWSFVEGWPSTKGATDTAALFAGFFAAKRALLPDVEGALAEIGQALVRRRTYDLLGVARPLTKRRGTLAPRIPSGVDPAALIEIGLWRKPEDDGRDGPLPFAFVHPSIGDEVVLAALASDGVPAGEALLRASDLAATTPTDAFPAVLSALSVLVERLARAGEGATLGWLLGGEDAAASEQLIAVALTSLGGPFADGGAAAQRAKKTLDEISTAALSDPRFASRLMEPLRQARLGLLASGHVAGAIAVERAALRVVRARIADAPSESALQIRLAASLAELLRLAIVDEDWALARKMANDATRLGEAGLATQPDDAALAASVTEAFLLAASVFVHDGRTKEARRALSSAIEISAVADAPNLRARALCELADVAIGEGNLGEARATLESALAIERAIVALDRMKDAEIRALAATLKRLGDVELASGLPRDARRRWEDAVSALRAVVAREPYFLGAATDLFATLRRLGNLARTEGRRDEARRALDEAIEGATFLASQPGVRARVEAELALALHDAGVLAFLEGKRGRATKLLTQAIEISSRLSPKAGNDELAHATASSLAYLGHVARAEGKRRESRTRFDEALAHAPLPGAREDRALDLANIHLAAAEVADSATMKNAHLLDARTLLEPYSDRPSAGRLLELVRRAERP